MSSVEHLTIAIAGFSSIIASSLKSLIEQSVSHRVIILDESADADNEFDKADIYLVEPEAFIFRLDYFMPRRQRVVILSRTKSTNAEGNPPVLSINASADEMYQLFRRIAKSINPVETESTQLTTRELDVLRQIAAGKTNKEIADSLVISVNTVITHRKNLSRKLGIRSASGLSLYAVMNGLITY